ncbi:nodulation protein E [Candidatus Vondammii sp. HM_W22]|uniref:nodulation protein E n=1 Tax=Candidatus Vondammii sp. HM_W22 TaxID=2687299 RepID=UPI001F1365D0|nr:nodulation protein E [Candidatus Vondammii sp. HM_W22]
MSRECQAKLLSTSEFYGPSEDLSTYCEAEFELRRNSEEVFDEASYREAMEMTLFKLKALEDERSA